jgi:hypothetical protein
MENSLSEVQNIFCFAKWSLIGTGYTVKIGGTSCGAYSFANPIGAPFTLRLICYFYCLSIHGLGEAIRLSKECMLCLKDLKK